MEKLNDGKVSEITIARQVPKESVEKLVSYDLPGVYYSRDNTRSYTYGSALCQVLGFTSNDGSGLSGIEKYYNEVLSGTDGEISYTTDIVGKETENSVVVYTEAVDGDGVQLTVDIDIQLAAEEAMRFGLYFKRSKVGFLCCFESAEFRYSGNGQLSFVRFK